MIAELLRFQDEAEWPTPDLLVHSLFSCGVRRGVLLEHRGDVPGGDGGRREAGPGLPAAGQIEARRRCPRWEGIRLGAPLRPCGGVGRRVRGLLLRQEPMLNFDVCYFRTN